MYLIKSKIAVSVLILFFCSSLKHSLFLSTAFDLGIFDQAIYLISQGESPLSSFLGFHILGDHAAFILYPISLFYRLYPDVHWLFLLQAIALSLGAYPIWRISLITGLNSSQAILASEIYLLYPLIFNLNLFDFHPDVLAVPSILWSILAVYCKQIGKFGLALMITLSCKAVFSLTVVGMGLWLILIEKRRLYGMIALFAGLVWFLLATQMIIPLIGGDSASVFRHINRYQDLGTSFSEILLNFILKPQLVGKRIFSPSTLEYIVLLFSPIIYILAVKDRKSLLKFTPAIPAFAINVLSNNGLQKDLLHQYSLSIVPFLILMVISCLQSMPNWLNNRVIFCWMILTFLLLSRVHFFFGEYWQSLDTWQSTREAISYIQGQGAVMTTAEIAPHLTHRRIVKLAIPNSQQEDLRQFDYILLNTRHPGWMSNTKFANDLASDLKSNLQFNLDYQKDGVYLFRGCLERKLPQPEFGVRC